MPVRSSMSQLIARTRLMISDPAGGSQQFADQDIQDTLDVYRNDLRYEGEMIAPTIANTASTNNVASVIFADYYSRWQWWESDVVLQGVNISTQASWVTLTPVASDYIVGHWQFELTPFVNGTVPGQYPPVFATGKVYDLYAAAADLLEFWAATLTGAYDVTVDGQTLRRSQLMSQKLTLAALYRRKALPHNITMTRTDVNNETATRHARLLDSDDILKGA